MLRQYLFLLSVQRTPEPSNVAEKIANIQRAQLCYDSSRKIALLDRQE